MQHAVEPVPPGTSVSSRVGTALRFSFDALGTAPLQIDAVYEGANFGNVGDDPIARLLPVGNQGGFRYRKAPGKTRWSLVVLYTDLADSDWPDVLDIEQGRFTYYGDNKRPGHDLHDTQRRGNQILRDAFEDLHASPARRLQIPPFLIFSKGTLGRDVVFRGLAAPGAPGVPPTDDLVAVWRTARGQRFQNYRSTFTILDARAVPRDWINDILAGTPDTARAPTAWRTWAGTGRYIALRAPTTRIYRAPDEQLPVTAADRSLIEMIYGYFDDPYAFEKCAARLWQMLTPAADYELTRRSRDGGRDAVGGLRLGPLSDTIKLDFALEAKRYQMTTGVGVGEMSRLISRLRHRQFGVLVTTSYVAPQAYQEIRDDEHPVVVIAARDIVDILRKFDIGTPEALQRWLESEFPRPKAVDAWSTPTGFAQAGVVGVHEDRGEYAPDQGSDGEPVPTSSPASSLDEAKSVLPTEQRPDTQS